MTKNAPTVADPNTCSGCPGELALPNSKKNSKILKKVLDFCVKVWYYNNCQGESDTRTAQKKLKNLLTNASKCDTIESSKERRRKNYVRYDYRHRNRKHH